jgi:uncharacterized protein (TIGR02996 family)
MSTSHPPEDADRLCPERLRAPFTDEMHSFVLACVHDIKDYLPRLVFADWLEEHGFHDLASGLRDGSR